MERRKFYQNIVSELILLLIAFMAFFGKNIGIIPINISFIGLTIMYIVILIIWYTILTLIKNSSKIKGDISLKTTKRVFLIFKICFVIFLLFSFSKLR